MKPDLITSTFCTFMKHVRRPSRSLAALGGSSRRGSRGNPQSASQTAPFCEREPNGAVGIIRRPVFYQTSVRLVGTALCRPHRACTEFALRQMSPAATGRLRAVPTAGSGGERANFPGKPSVCFADSSLLRKGAQGERLAASASPPRNPDAIKTRKRTVMNENRSAGYYPAQGQAYKYADSVAANSRHKVCGDAG